MVKWEYKVIPIRTRIHAGNLAGTSKPAIDEVQDELDALGKEGWELVSVQDNSTQDGRSYTVVYLKRQKQPKKKTS